MFCAIGIGLNAWFDACKLKDYPDLRIRKTRLLDDDRKSLINWHILWDFHHDKSDQDVFLWNHGISCLGRGHVTNDRVAVHLTV